MNSNHHSIAILPPFPGLRRFPEVEDLSNGQVMIQKH